MTRSVEPEITEEELVAQFGAAEPESQPEPLPEAPTPVTRARIRDSLERLHLPHSVDSELRIWMQNPRGRLMIRLEASDGHTLSVRGRWAGKLPMGERAAALEVANDLHREQYWPTVTILAPDEGIVRVSAEADVRCEAGMTDAQLDSVLSCFTASVFGAFRVFSKRFPEAMPSS